MRILIVIAFCVLLVQGHIVRRDDKQIESNFETPVVPFFESNESKVIETELKESDSSINPTNQVSLSSLNSSIESSNTDLSNAGELTSEVEEKPKEIIKEIVDPISIINVAIGLDTKDNQNETSSSVDQVTSNASVALESPKPNESFASLSHVTSIENRVSDSFVKIIPSNEPFESTPVESIKETESIEPFVEEHKSDSFNSESLAAIDKIAEEVPSILSSQSSSIDQPSKLESAKDSIVKTDPSSQAENINERANLGILRDPIAETTGSEVLPLSDLSKPVSPIESSFSDQSDNFKFQPAIEELKPIDKPSDIANSAPEALNPIVIPESNPASVSESFSVVIPESNPVEPISPISSDQISIVSSEQTPAVLSEEAPAVSSEQASTISFEPSSVVSSEQIPAIQAEPFPIVPSETVSIDRTIVPTEQNEKLPFDQAAPIAVISESVPFDTRSASIDSPALSESLPIDTRSASTDSPALSESLPINNGVIETSIPFLVISAPIKPSTVETFEVDNATVLNNLNVKSSATPVEEVISSAENTSSVSSGEALESEKIVVEQPIVSNSQENFSLPFDVSSNISFTSEAALTPLTVTNVTKATSSSSSAPTVESSESQQTGLVQLNETIAKASLVGTSALSTETSSTVTAESTVASSPSLSVSESSSSSSSNQEADSTSNAFPPSSDPLNDPVPTAQAVAAPTIESFPSGSISTIDSEASKPLSALSQISKSDLISSEATSGVESSSSDLLTNIPFSSSDSVFQSSSATVSEEPIEPIESIVSSFPSSDSSSTAELVSNQPTSSVAIPSSSAFDSHGASSSSESFASTSERESASDLLSASPPTPSIVHIVFSKPVQAHLLNSPISTFEPSVSDSDYSRF